MKYRVGEKIREYFSVSSHSVPPMSPADRPAQFSGQILMFMEDFS